MKPDHNCNTCGVPLANATLLGEPITIEARPHPHGNLTTNGRYDHKPRLQRPARIPQSEAFRYLQHQCPTPQQGRQR